MVSPFSLMRRAAVFAICVVATSASAIFAGPKDNPSSDAECSSDVKILVSSFYKNRWIRPYESRSNVETRLRKLAEEIAAQKLELAPCYFEIFFPISGFAGYLNGEFSVSISADGMCLNENDLYYDLKSKDIERYPWRETRPGDFARFPARSVRFLPMCFSLDGHFLEYGK